MTDSDSIAWYDDHVREVAPRYEALAFPDVHAWLRPRLPSADGALVLDVGAGTGRDAAWLAEQGYEVVAVEPSRAMREEAERRHPHPRIRFLDDRLPALARVARLGTDFDVILLSAVWMHVAPADRARAFRKPVNLLKPGGLLALTLRDGPAEPERRFYPVGSEEVERLAREHGAFIEHVGTAPDKDGRSNVRWTEIAVRLPDDGTGALPLLRHIILNDAKSSTYKLALLRTLCRIADGTAGMSRDAGESHVSVPLGLVALTWVRLFHPLIRGDFPQAPRLSDGRGLSFVRQGFREVMKLPAGDLRIGMRFTGEGARALHAALKDARRAIVDQPTFYMTYADGKPILRPVPRRMAANPAELMLDEPYLLSFGELQVPRELWHAMQRFSVWVEPAIVAEWRRLMREYAEAQGRRLDEARMIEAMTWSEPTRDVQLTRARALELLEEGRVIRCTWSGKALTPGNLDIDHCFPWSAWPCNDLWNLLPVRRDVNGRKGARLPAAATLQSAAERIIGWWDEGYRRAANLIVPERFVREAAASLPTLVGEGEPALEDIYESVNLKRVRLKHDQRVPEWAAN